MAYGVFHSVSGGNTYYYDNDFHVDFQSPGSKAECAACYIVGNNGGEWYGNRITTNTHAFWVGTRYGNLNVADIHNNTVIRAGDAPEDFRPVRMGFAGRENVTVKDVSFRSNEFIGTELVMDITDEDHEFSVMWTLSTTVLDTNGQAIGGRTVEITDVKGTLTFTGTTGDNGNVIVELPEYTYENGMRDTYSPYTVRTSGEEREVELTKNTEIIVGIE